MNNQEGSPRSSWDLGLDATAHGEVSERQAAVWAGPGEATS